MVAGLIAVATLTTGAFLFWLISNGSIGVVEFRWLCVVALTSFLVAAIAFFLVVRLYSVESRKYGLAFFGIAVSCFVLAMTCCVPIVLLVLRDTGVLTLDRFW